MGEGQVILVTGASSGVGKLCAQRLAERGHVVYGTSRRARDMEPRETGYRVLPMDVTDEQSVKETAEEILHASGRLDAVVNNAGIGLAGPVEQTSIEEAQALLETNLLGALRVCRQALPVMRGQRRGTIINISSLAGRVGLPFQGLYSATKFGLEGMSEALRLEVRRWGIRVVVIAPGDLCTEFTDNRRLASAWGGEGLYGEAMLRVLRRVEVDERGGPVPDRVAGLVVRVVEGRARRDWYSAGRIGQRLPVALRPFIPRRMYERALMWHYRV